MHDSSERLVHRDDPGVLKDISADGLIRCIHDVLAGKTYLAPAAAAKLTEGVARMQLTPRER